ncbi:MAG: hypothetical protein K0R20_817 [Actinomycetia bacterium]|jgi:hypothetical protein|nr:hypothetical protein [Actinomycetes bacterium]
MMRRLVIAVVLMASTTAGVLTAGAGRAPVDAPEVADPEGCPSLLGFPRRRPGLVSGRGVWAVAGGELVSVGTGRVVSREVFASEGAPQALAESFERSAIKHVAVRRGIGTAFVIDRAGDDDLVAVTSEGVEVMPQTSEVSHPTWSAGGRLAWSTGSAIVVRDLVTGEMGELSAPVRGATVFSPVFLSDRRIAAVVSAPPDDRVPEGERLGELWATNVSGRGWHRLTHFEAGADRWVTIRTPTAHAGVVDFVRVSARASSTEAPRFELWRYEDGDASRVRRLDGERYLAGRLHGQVVWNRPDPVHGRHLLQVEGALGMRTIGCGAVMVDPIDVADPDRRAGGSYEPLRGEHAAASEATDVSDDEVAVIVGDFPTAVEAEAVARLIRRAYPGSIVDVVDSEDAPLAIRPGVFGALLHLPDDADASAAIAQFRATLPAYSSNSWIVTP